MKESTLKKRCQKEMKIIALMAEIYCKGKHKTKNGLLCQSCTELLQYANKRIKNCPHMQEKTFCSNCKTHCYKEEMRAEIKDLMRYAGPRMLLHHPWLALCHAQSGLKQKRRNHTCG